MTSQLVVSLLLLVLLSLSASSSAIEEWWADAKSTEGDMLGGANDNESAPRYTYTTKWFKQRVDHFSFSNEDHFEQRFLVNDTFWDQERGGGPVFFYTGNEGDIEAFAQNSGLMWDLAPEFGAMLIFAEHRYYGKSMPYGKKSTKVSFIGTLTYEPDTY